MNRNQRLTRSAIILAVLATISVVLGLIAMIFGPLLSLQITGAFIILLGLLLASIAHSFLGRMVADSEPRVPDQFEQLLAQTQRVVKASKRLKDDQQALIQCLQASPLACWMKDAQNQFVFVNAAWIALTGVSEKEWLSKEASIPTDFLTRIQDTDHEAIAKRAGQRAVWTDPAKGTFDLYSQPTVDGNGTITGTAGWLTQSTGEKTHTAQSNPLIDPTTQLGNYRFATEWLQQAIDGGDEELAVILVNVSGFSKINHRVGHQQADSLLVEIGRRVAGLCDDNTQAARIEKDHFALLIKRIEQPETIVARVAQLNQVLHASYALTNLGMQPEFVIGMARFVVNAETASELIHAAQADMRHPAQPKVDADPEQPTDSQDTDHNTH